MRDRTEGLGGQAAQRCRAQRGEHHVGTLADGGHDALAQPSDEPDSGRPRIPVPHASRPLPHEAPGITRQQPALKPAPADQPGEHLVGSQGDLMAHLQQSLPKPGEWRHVTP